VIIRRRPLANRRPTDRPRVLTAVRRGQHQPAATRDETAVPTLYVLNAPAITQPHAIQHLAFDLRGCEVDIAVNGVITETYRKKKHADHCFAIDGYCLFRRDRLGSRGGGVAVYVNNVMSAEIGTYPGDSPDYELLWISDRYP